MNATEGSQGHAFRSVGKPLFIAFFATRNVLSGSCRLEQAQRMWANPHLIERGATSVALSRSLQSLLGVNILCHMILFLVGDD